ncbi:MAG: hypothetical protein KDD69_17635 [Bdellovibrionales bacterium]|nr:hypothetical protein [Bdellovibrionales bacterium]
MADGIPQNESPTTLQSIVDGVFLGDLSDNSSATKVGTQIAAGLIPGVGQVADARDTYAALTNVVEGKEGSGVNLAIAVAGWVPLAGDLLKSVHRVGLRETLHMLGETADSVRATWRAVRDTPDEKLGEAGSLFYRPATELEAVDVDFGALGETNRYGDIKVQEGLSDTVRESVLNHELVHRFFSPTLRFGQEVRAALGLTGYLSSHLLRRVEEGLAEAWAGFKRNGISGAREGWKFPYRANYGIDPERVSIERNAMIGMMSTAAGTGATIGDALAASRDEQR